MLKRNNLFLIILIISFLINFASTSDSEQCSDKNSEFLNEYEEFRGNPCVIENTGGNGFCTHRRQCPLVDRDYKNFNKGNYTSCGFKCCKEIICCPNPIIENKRISEKKCLEYSKTTVFETVTDVKNLSKKRLDNCWGLIPPAFSGVLQKEFPYIALIGHRSSENKITWNCGGALISDQYILTSTNCFNNTEQQVNIVQLGIVNTKNNDFNSSIEFSINNTINHPNFIENNIGLIKLANKVKFNPFIRPACLPASNDVIKRYYISPQWVVQNDDNLLLEKNSIQVKQKNDCNEENNICGETYRKTENLLKTGSGGPLQSIHEEFYMMVSIVGVHGGDDSLNWKKVYPSLEWIENIVWSDKE